MNPYIYPKNKQHFLKLLEFTKQILEICEKNRIPAVIYGSFSHFHHTKDESMELHDIDLLLPRNGLKKLIHILKKNKVNYKRCSSEDFSLIAKKGNSRIELDEVGTGYKSIKEDSLKKDIFNEIDFYGVKARVITLSQLEEIYSIAYNRSHDDKIKISKKIARLEKALGRSIEWINPDKVVDGFEDKILSNLWSREKFEARAIKIQSKIKREGVSAIQITVRSKDKFEDNKSRANNSERDEIREQKYLWAKEGEAYRYSFSIFIPKNFPIVSTRLVLAQWKHHDEKGNALVDNPLIAARYQDKVFRITLQTSEEKINLFKTIEEIRGKWLDMVFEIKFTRNNFGFVKIWMNKRKIVNYKGRTAYSEKEGYPYPGRFHFRIGLYRDLMKKPMTVYFDNYIKERIT